MMGYSGGWYFEGRYDCTKWMVSDMHGMVLGRYLVLA